MGLTKPRASQIYNLDYKQATRVVTITNITLTGGAPNAVDGVNLVLGDRILVTGQSTGSQNGLYLVTTLGTGSNGTWARSTDANDTGEIEAGMIIMVTEGNIYADTQWKLITNDPITVGTTALSFTQNYSANSISSGNSNVVVNSNSTVTISSAGTANVLTVSSTGTVVSGTGSVTGNITGANVLTGGLISATGNVTGGNILGGANVNATTHTGTTVSVTANITGGNILTGGLISATGNVTGGNLITSGKVYGLELNSTQSAGDEGGQINLTAAATNTTVSGNLIIDVFQNKIRFYESAGTNRGAYMDITQAAASVGTNLLAGGGGGTPGGSNTYVQFNDGGLFGGNSQFTYNKATNTLAAGIISATNNGNGTNFQVGDDAYIGDINTADTMSIRGQQNAANGYIVFGNADSTGKLGRAGSGPLTYAGAFSATGNITGSYILGNGASLTGVITSVANINNGTSNVTVVSSGGNISVGVGGTSNVAVFATTGEYITGVVSASGNITGGNLLTGGLISVTGNVIGGNVTTVGLISATGNITGGNLLTGGLISSTSTITSAANITGGNILTAGIMSSTGNAIHGNVLTAGLISATGTITSAATVQGLTVSATGNVIGGNVTTAGIMSSTGNAIHGNVLTAGLISATGGITGSSFTGAGTGLTGTASSLTVGTATVAGTVTTTAQPNITSVGILSSLSVTGNVNSGNLITSGSGGNITGANVISATTISTSQIINSGANATGNIGSSTTYFNTVFAKATSAQYADLAEMYVADQDYPPGTVVEFGGEFEITATTQTHSTRTAGIVSTNPSYLMNSAQEGEHVLPIALTGRVPCRVSGTIRKGDRLVAGPLRGIAIPMDSQLYEPGCIIGKALEDYDSVADGIIEVAVGRF
jgi:hypothetical protein